MFQLETKNQSLNGVKERRERASLPQPSRSLEEWGSSAIDEGGYPGLTDAGLDPRDEFGGKPKSQHYLEEKRMANSIKRISQIEFHRHSFISVLLARVYGFLY